MTLSFTLLGQVALSKDGEPLNRFRSQKELALLVYLAHTGQSHSREFVAELLWEGRSTKLMGSNLRTALARLRPQVDDALVVTRASLALAPESLQRVDSVQLLQTLSNFGSVDSTEKAAALQGILDTYLGDFLADFYLSDAPQFDEWMMTTREQIRRQVLSAYHKLGQYALTEDEVDLGIAIARRWLGVDALDETAHMLLIRSLLKAGTMREAIAQYDAYVDLLHAELDVGPPAEMTKLIRDALPSPSIPVRQPTNTARHNLPPVYDQFLGRIVAQQDIHSRLDQPWCRLVSIIGPGGVGKTRLATTIAHSRLGHYQDGVWLVELADVDPEDDDLAEAIAIEIATALDLRLIGSSKPAEQLLDHLQHKQTLLVLDNFEHLFDGMQIVFEILRRCQTVQMLVTSREALRIRAEWTIDLAGLPYPASDTDETASDAVDLFVARRAQQRHEPISPENLTAIRTICRMVGGLPLAIELAAALTRDAWSRDVADRLRAGFDTLATSLRDAPERHRSLRIVFDMSWHTLTPAVQKRLARLSVFLGGFTEAAAQHVADADAQHLAVLRDKSLIIADSMSGRYALHPVVRAYAAEKLPAADLLPQKHARFYLTLLATHTKALQKERPQLSVVAIEPEFDNLRLAWQTGLAHRQIDLLSPALTPLSLYYQLRGLSREAEAAMQSTASAATGWGPEGIPLATRAGLEQARFQNRLGRYRSALGTIEKTLTLAGQCEDRWAEAMGHVLWGESLWRLGEYDVAETRLAHALTIVHVLDDPLIIGWCHHHLGIIHDIQNRYSTALEHLQQACAAWRTIDNAQALTNSLNSIGLVCYHQGNLPAAQQTMEQALSLCNQIDNRHLRALLLNNLGMIATEQGDYMGAQYYLQLGLDLAMSSGNLTSQGELYANLGKNYHLLGKSDLAIESLEQGVRIAESIENRPLLATVLLNMAGARQKPDDAERTEALYRQALTIARQGNLQAIQCQILIGMAESWSKTDESRAREYSAQAVALAETLQNPDLLRRAHAIGQYVGVFADVNEGNLL